MASKARDGQKLLAIPLRHDWMMVAMVTRVIFIGLLLAGLACLLISPDQNGIKTDQDLVGSAARNDQITAVSPDQPPPNLPGKSAERPAEPSVTIEDTLELLRDTIIPVGSYSDQTLAERTAAINRQLEQAGIPSHQLRVRIHHRLARQAGESAWKLGELELRNAPVAEVLKYTCGSTKLRYRALPGVVEFVLATESHPGENPGRNEERAPGEEDPFESDSKRPMTSDPVPPKKPVEDDDVPFALRNFASCVLLAALLK